LMRWLPIRCSASSRRLPKQCSPIEAHSHATQEPHTPPAESLRCVRTGSMHEEPPAGAASALNCSSSAAAVVGQWGKVLGVTFQ
jgi:hypothetical protein